MSFSSCGESNEYIEHPDGAGCAGNTDGQDFEFVFAPDADPDNGYPAGAYMGTTEMLLGPGTFDLGAAYNPMAGSDDPEGERGERADSGPETTETRMAELAGLLEEQKALPHRTYDRSNPPTVSDYSKEAARYVETRFPDEPPEDRKAHAEELAGLLLKNDLARLAAIREVSILPDDAPEEISDEEITEWQNERAAEVIGIIEDVTNNDPLGNQFSVDKDGIFLPAEGDHILAVLRAVDPQPGEKMIDIGSGDGRWPMVAGAALGMDAYGYERSAGRHELAERVRDTLLDEGIEEAAGVHLLHEDFFGADISDADVIVYYLGGGPSKSHVEDKIMREAKDGARVIFYNLFEQDYASRMTETANNVPGVSMPTRIYRVDRQQPQQP